MDLKLEVAVVPVSDVDRAKSFYAALGWHLTPTSPRPASADDRVAGPDPDRRSYCSFVSFSDPDGNGWILHEIATRLPGRADPAATAFASAEDLAHALRRAAAAHGEHEARIGAEDPDWPDWYATTRCASRPATTCPSNRAPSLPKPGGPGPPNSS